MKHKFFILISFLLFSGTILNAQKNDVAIRKEYQRIENLKTLKIDSLTHIRGIDFNRGNNVDEKKYKIFKEKKKIVKIQYEEIGGIGNYNREWNKRTIIYLKNDIPFFVTENTNGMMTLYLLEGGEKSEPYNQTVEIYVYDWNNEKVKRVYNGNEAKPQMNICKSCYEELIEKIKLEFNAKQ